MVDFEIITDGAAEFYDGYLKQYPTIILSPIKDEKGYHPVAPKVANEVLEKILEEGKDVLYIGMTASISHSFEVVSYIAKGLRIKYPDRKIEFIDSMTSGAAEGLIVYYASKMKKEGKSLDDIVNFIESNKTKFKSAFTLEDPTNNDYLNYNKGQSSDIDIQPIFGIDSNGNFSILAKVLGRKKATLELLKMLKNNYDENGNDFIIVEYICEKFEALSLQDKIKEKFPNIKVKLIKASNYVEHQLASDGIGIAYKAK